ncbi:KGK domain-containing protein [Lyngbya aestuarii]|uniref:KGK domain-containing protein n=1 Tax=Lyngbya aestuarii TaxID=118322 RepID=UPI00403DF474
MEDNYNLQEVNDDYVLSFGNDMCKVGRFKEAFNQLWGNEMGKNITDYLDKQGIKIAQSIPWLSSTWSYVELFRKGIDCEMLKIGSHGWEKGKVRVRITLEFCPEQSEVEKIPLNNGTNNPESPLDDLRQRIN